MDLSSEDSLRLNILLCQDVKAIRISEARMMLYALLSDKEISIKLTANCNADKYIKAVKELLSSYYLNSPAGYPVFISRWTRTGQVKSDNVDKLLKIGEPEAVVSVTFSEKISAEHARYAWWSYPSVENARQLLTHDNVAESELAGELAEFLLEFLPFETEAKDIILTVKLLLQRELMDEANRKSTWLKGKRKAAYLIGFLCADVKHFPEKEKQNPFYEKFSSLLEVGDNRPGSNSNSNLDQSQKNEILSILSAEGQSYITSCIHALDRFSDQDSIVMLYDAMQNYFGKYHQLAEQLQHHTDPRIQLIAQALFQIAQINQQDLTPVLSQSNAVGSLLRRKLKPITEPVLTNLRYLLSSTF